MRLFGFALLISSTALPGIAQKFGAAENLAPYVPTPEFIVDRMLEAGRVKPGDVVYDLGSGDGRIVIRAAEKFGARAVGVEIRPDLCLKANQQIRAKGLEDRVKMIEDSALRVDLSAATVVTMYLLTSSNDRLRPNLEKYLRSGARVVSNEFPIRGWRASEVVHIKTGKMEHTLYVYEMGKTR